MKIMDIELLHGAVLTRLMRKEREKALKMFEFNADNYHSVYILMDNDGDKPLYIKHSKAPQPGGRNDIEIKWVFTFQPSHLHEICKLADDFGNVNIILVCGNKKIGDDNTYIALISFDELKRCVDTTGKSGQQRVSIGDKGGKNYLRVWGSRIKIKDSFGVSENALNELLVCK